MNREFQTLIATIIQDPTQRVRTLLSGLQSRPVRVSNISLPAAT